MIDDDEQFRELVQHFCTKAGHVFTGADSAAAALATLAAQPCDVLLVDLNIPGTSGAQVLREIRAAGDRSYRVAHCDLAMIEAGLADGGGFKLAREVSGRCANRCCVARPPAPCHY